MRALRCGEFEVLNEIACGGMGLVFKARHKRLNRIVALKTIRSGILPSTEETFRRLRFEAEVIASLDHPNIVPLYEVGEHCGRPYLVLKLIPGGDLERHVPRLRKKPRAVARLLARVARTLHYAHLRGVLHCDLKPSNILLDTRGEPHVTDFGLAKFIEAESGMTQSGLILGTPSYMAPEQVSGSAEQKSTEDRRTSMAWGPYSTSCSPAGHRSRPRPYTRPCSACGSISRRPFARTTAGSTENWKRFASGAWRKTRVGDTTRPRR